MPHIISDGFNSKLDKTIMTNRLAARVTNMVSLKGQTKINVQKTFQQVLNVGQTAPGELRLDLDAYRKNAFFASGTCVNIDFFEGLLGLCIHVPCTMQVRR